MAESAKANPRVVSRTAAYVAAGRAVGAREPDPSVRNPDHLAEALLGDPSKLDLDLGIVRALSLDYDEAMKDFEVVNPVRLMLVRTRFIDDALERAVANGATQVVILGAGYDSHAYRFGESMPEVGFFEVDRPVTQALKRQRVDEVLGGPPANLTYVPVDFHDDNLRDVLARHGHDAAQRTFFIMEGVTMYLTEDAVRDTLRFVATHAPGSTIVFDFVYRPLVEGLRKIDVAALPEATRPMMERFLELIRDEPWEFGFPLAGEHAFLDELGLELREALTVGGEESIRRYLTRAGGTELGADVIARAMARAAETLGALQATDRESLRARMREQQRIMAYQLGEAVVR